MEKENHVADPIDWDIRGYNNSMRQMELWRWPCRWTNDFDMICIRSSIRTLFPSWIVVLVAAGFFGYILGLLLQRVGTIVSPWDDEKALNRSIPPTLYIKSMKSSVRPPLIPTEGEQEQQEESFLGLLEGFLSAPVYQSQKSLDRHFQGLERSH
ncbi:hypothetical protein Vadar_023322 [Vaccinium darrowii]|uniref:Uncharacterized protein n=1 Tax=Vaccinium darrowii TaxID=229202 RepID=A0ACB7YXR5_9ERIC|nr:hypothetical protein Vadar_023322 [Vaccinium darrowii]